MIVPNAAGPDLVIAQQILLEKQTLDCFTNVNLVGILQERLNADRYIVYGVVTEICVKFAAFGLLKTGRRVEIVTDAVSSLSAEASRENSGGVHGGGRSANQRREDRRDRAMSQKTLLTADELERMPDDDSVQIELDEGELITMPPAGEEHGDVGAGITILLGNFVKKHREFPVSVRD